MSDLIARLRDLSSWLRGWDPDEGKLQDEAADRIEALEAQVERLTRIKLAAMLLNGDWDDPECRENLRAALGEA